MIRVYLTVHLSRNPFDYNVARFTVDDDGATDAEIHSAAWQYVMRGWPIFNRFTVDIIERQAPGGPTVRDSRMSL